MNFNIQSRGFDLTEAIRSRFEDSIRNKLGKIIDLDADNVSLFAEVEKTTGANNGEDLYHAQLIVRISGDEHYSKEEMHDMYMAIDKVCDEIFHIVNKKNDKEKDLERREGKKFKKMLRKLGL